MTVVGKAIAAAATLDALLSSAVRPERRSAAARFGLNPSLGPTREECWQMRLHRGRLKGRNGTRRGQRPRRVWFWTRRGLLLVLDERALVQLFERGSQLRLRVH